MSSRSSGKKSDYFIQSIEAASKVAESFLISGKQVMPLHEIIEITGFTKNRVFRIISTLTDLGYLLKEGRGAGYSLGAKYLLLGEHVRNRSNLRQKAEPFLDEMVEATNDAAHLYTTIGRDLVCVSQKVGSHMVQAAGHIGEHIPIHIGPAKAILAHQSQEQIDQYLDEVEIIPFTERTITDKTELRAELAVIRRQGYCVDHEGFEDGCHAFSAPIRDFSGIPIAAFVLAVPRIRYSEQKGQQAIHLTHTAGMELSTQLGFSV